jgi:hypothetical protein
MINNDKITAKEKIYRYTAICNNLSNIQIEQAVRIFYNKYTGLKKKTRGLDKITLNDIDKQNARNNKLLDLLRFCIMKNPELTISKSIECVINLAVSRKMIPEPNKRDTLFSKYISALSISALRTIRNSKVHFKDLALYFKEAVPLNQNDLFIVIKKSVEKSGVHIPLPEDAIDKEKINYIINRNLVIDYCKYGLIGEFGLRFNDIGYSIKMIQQLYNEIKSSLDLNRIINYIRCIVKCSVQLQLKSKEDIKLIDNIIANCYLILDGKDNRTKFMLESYLQSPLDNNKKRKITKDIIMKMAKGNDIKLVMEDKKEVKKSNIKLNNDTVLTIPKLLSEDAYKNGVDYMIDDLIFEINELKDKKPIDNKSVVCKMIVDLLEDFSLNELNKKVCNIMKEMKIQSDFKDKDYIDGYNLFMESYKDNIDCGNKNQKVNIIKDHFNLKK